MSKTFKYLKKLLRELDVSPYDSNNSLRPLIYAVWAFSAIMFLENDFSTTIEKFSYSDNSGQYSYCTVLKKVNSFDIYVEDITIVQTTQFIIIPPDDNELPTAEVATPLCARAPPYTLFT